MQHRHKMYAVIIPRAMASAAMASVMKVSRDFVRGFSRRYYS